ncbi:MAG: group I intron-associated PD-(D/E)XK endonuclease [Terriglobales bacterium]
MKVSLRHTKEQGEWAELRFMARAITQGLKVAKPWGDSARYDLIVEYQGSLKRVQVKSTRPRHYGGYVCHLSTGRSGYSRNEVEFLALYLIPEDLWYIIPIEHLEGAQTVLLVPSKPTHRFHIYQEAWHLLRDDR